MSDFHDDGPPSFMGAGGRQGFRNGDEVPAGHVDHMERARRRISELRAQYGDGDGDGDTEVYRDKFFAEAPPGWTYEWKLHTCYNKSFPEFTSEINRGGWTPVPAGRVRHLLLPEYTDESVIIDGLMLMERPRELTERRRMRERIMATELVRTSEAKLVEAPPGTAPRDQHRKTQPRVGSTVGPIGIPD